MSKRIEHKGLLVLTMLDIKQFIKHNGEQDTIDMITKLMSIETDENNAIDTVVEYI